MRLIKAECQGYRRFREAVEIDLDPDLVCIVGPNAAGKSSLLNALTHLNDNRNVGPAEESRANRRSGEGTIRVSARFVVDDADRRLLRHIREAKDVRQFVLSKEDRYRREIAFEPPVTQDPSEMLPYCLRVSTQTSPDTDPIPSSPTMVWSQQPSGPS